jgi:hypothetical protein
MAGGAIALALWLPSGPLGKDWARRAGTPANLLTPPAAQATTVAAAPPSLPVPFTARARGRLRSGVTNDGTALVDIRLRSRDGPAAVLDVRLSGSPLDGGGVSVSRSQVTLGPPADPARYIGRATALDGSVLEARLRPARGRALRVHVLLDLGGSNDGGPVTATVTARPERDG